MNKKSKKILFFSHESLLFGAPRSLLQIIEKFDQYYNVRVITYGDGLFVYSCEEIGIPIEVLLKKKIFINHKNIGRIINYVYSKIEILINFIRILYFVIKFMPDIIYVNTVIRSMPVIVAKILRIPTLVHVREGENFIKPVSRRSRKRMQLIASADNFICISKANQEVFIKHGKVDTKKTIVIHNGIDTEKYTMSAERRKKFRKKYEISQDIILIGFVGNVSYRKGTDIFLEASLKLVKKNKSFDRIRFLIVGGTWNQIQNLNIDISDKMKSNYIVIPFIEDVRPAYDAIDIFSMTSRAEPFGRTNIEASSMEKAIVSTKVDGCLEIFTDKVNALMIEPDSPEQLVEAWEKLIEDKVLRERLGRAARENVLENFSEQKTIKKIMNIIDQM